MKQFKNNNNMCLQYCQGMGGYLAEICSLDEFNAIAGILPGSTWIGGNSYDSMTGNHFTWQTSGIPVSSKHLNGHKSSFQDIFDV